MSRQDLFAAAEQFVAAYHAHDKLCRDQAGWDCVVVLQASDTARQVSLHIRDGRVAALSPTPADADLTVTASLEILLDILEFRLNPNQPYLFGELTLLGREEDFLRVDYIATLLCAR
jgi:putative sterol carrier protein